MRKIISFMFAFLIIPCIAYSASIHGQVYDMNFNKLTNAIVEIDSIPKQSVIVKDSGYNFKVNPGNYTIRSYYIKNQEITAFTEENFLIKDYNGDYNLDLILFPYINDNEDLNISLIDYNNYLKEKDSNNLPILLVILSIMSILVVVYLVSSFRHTMKKSVEISTAIDKIKKESIKETNVSEDKAEASDEYLEKCYSIISEEKRINQKELRKRMALSESKVSMILTQLEHDGKIKRIKKGRGNLIILTK